MRSKKTTDNFIILFEILIIGFVLIFAICLLYFIPAMEWEEDNIAEKFCISLEWEYDRFHDICWRVLNDTYEERDIKVISGIAYWVLRNDRRF